MLCGMCASVVPVFFKVLVHDKHTLGAESDAYATATARGGSAMAPPQRNGRAAAAAPGVDACMPQDILDLKSNAAPYCHHSREPGRGRPSLPVILSGAELCIEPTHDANGGVYAGDPSASAAAAAGVTGADQETPPRGSSTGKASIEGWLQEAHGAAAALPVGPLLEVNGVADLPDEGDVKEPLLGAGERGSSGAAAGVNAGCVRVSDTAAWAWWPEALVVGPAWVPYVIFLSDLMFGLASGMTIKFFPIFFMEKVRCGCVPCGAGLCENCLLPCLRLLRCQLRPLGRVSVD